MTLKGEEMSVEKKIEKTGVENTWSDFTREVTENAGSKFHCEVS